MALGLSRLGAKEIERPVPAGRYADGGGLYLSVSKTGAKAWVFMAQKDGKRREIGLGSLLSVSVGEARAKAAAIRAEVSRGVDPEVARDNQRRTAVVQGTTFKDCTEAYIKAHRAGWRSPKHARQWQATLERYAFPKLGNMPVSNVSTQDVLAVLSGLWTRAPETASRVRGRIEAVLDAARAQGLRTGENPAAWRGNLKHLLPAKAKLARVEHRAAMPYADVPAFYAALRDHSAPAAKALRFVILTAARANEVLGTTWGELDMAAKVWTVPADRMKGNREHVVPLSDEAVALLQSIKPRPGNDYVFPGYVKGKGLSHGALLQFMRRGEQETYTVHGFRSSFRDWAADCTNFPDAVAEAALAHVNGDKVEAAYRRTKFIEKRRALMAAWAGHVAGVVGAANVVPLRAA